MSFRKRNTPIEDSRTPRLPSRTSSTGLISPVRVPGTRPSAIDGRLVTSTGTGTIDSLLAGHGGLPLGAHLLIEENGTTDYAGAFLRFYAAEGVLQGHQVHVVGLPESWGRDLPGTTTKGVEKTKESIQESSRMKIAWRYETLGQQDVVSRDRALETRNEALLSVKDPLTPFNHTFDLTKRLDHPKGSHLDFISLERDPLRNPFSPMLLSLVTALSASSTTVHRLILPTLLSPALYPPHSREPSHLLATFHSLRSLLSAYSNRLTIFSSLPTTLHPRTLGLTRWLEILADGVLELLPFPHASDAEFATSRGPNVQEEPPQGLLRLHKLPVLHDLGSGFPPSDMDWTFVLSRRKLTIRPFDLPPIEGDTEARQNASAENSAEKPNMADLEF